MIVLASPDVTTPNCGPMSATDSASSMKPEGTDPAHMGTDTRMAISPTFQIIGKLEKFSDGNCGLSASFGNIAA